jgi:hypothetical protein
MPTDVITREEAAFVQGLFAKGTLTYQVYLVALIKEAHYSSEHSMSRRREGGAEGSFSAVGRRIVQYETL